VSLSNHSEVGKLVTYPSTLNPLPFTLYPH